MTDPTEQDLTPKQELSEVVQDAPKTRAVQYGEEKFVVKKLPWGRFKSLLKRLQEFAADIIPEQMTDDQLDNLESLQGFSLPDIIRKFPVDFVENLVEYGVNELPDDFLETLDFDTVLFLAGHVVSLNFLDNTGVRSFFTAFVTVIKPSTDDDSPKKKDKIRKR